MDIGKHTASAVFAALCGAVAGFGAQYVTIPKEKIVEKMVHLRSAPPSKRAWPDLTMDETIAIGEKLTGPLKGASVSIFCNDSLCDELAHDLDDSMQIADVGSSLDRSALPLGYGFSIVANAGDSRAQIVADAIKEATSGKLSPDVKTAKVAEGSVLIAIGNLPRR